ncbi:MAG: aconitate hydratase AcnA [Desulfobacteraceae bacterium]|nr:MAG: aconitate hydratase AcnA [Desulfobacteraceae bacterium]
MSLCKNSFNTRASLLSGNQAFTYFSLNKLAGAGFNNIQKMPYSIRILLENLLRNEDGCLFTEKDIISLTSWNPDKASEEIPFLPARVLLQDFTGVPAIVDLAAMRDAAKRLNCDPLKINPKIPAELVIDHSVQVDSFGKEDSLEENLRYEFTRNSERYTFLRWGQKNFNNFRVVPPGTGICHQVNLEYLARVVFIKEADGGKTVFPDSVLGLDSHTTMINGSGVLGWGVGGIEAEAVMLGNPYYLLTPQVLGFKLTGKLPDGTTATDLVLYITELLRKKGVVGKFVEFYGAGLSNLGVEDRATIANMAPEYGATTGFFPVDDITLKYLRLTGRPGNLVSLVEKYTKEQGLFLEKSGTSIIYNDTVEFDISTVTPCIAGPNRPQERIPLFKVRDVFKEATKKIKAPGKRLVVDIDGTSAGIDHGSVVIAAITSCTNTSNPSVMIGAGLLAKKAVLKGLSVKPWVKTSLSPGSRVAASYLETSGLIHYLKQLKFHITAYGCTTCIGNSGPLNESVSRAIRDNDLVVASVLSGNRNFEGRISPLTRANFLASPPLVVAYAIAGKIDIDFETEPLGLDSKGKPVFLVDIWPSAEEIRIILETLLIPEMFENEYSTVFEGSEQWKALPVPESYLFKWDPVSTYIKNPPFFDEITTTVPKPEEIKNARVLALLGNMVTTDHISPAGTIPADSPAGKYLISKEIEPNEFNSFGSRRGNHEVMVRGTFGNIRLKNKLVPDKTGGWTLLLPEGNVMPIYDASELYRKAGIPLIVIAGREYGTGSSRDWAAKGTALLGVKAVIAESFERIHRSNLVCMGILPLQFEKGTGQETLKLDGTEVYDITGIEKDLCPQKKLSVSARHKDGNTNWFTVTARIDSRAELNYFIHGGILPYVLRTLK